MVDICEHKNLWGTNVYTSEQIFTREYTEAPLFETKTKRVRIKFEVCPDCNVMFFEEEIEVK